MTSESRVILCGDVSNTRLEELERILKKDGFGVLIVSSADQCLSACIHERPDAVVLDTELAVVADWSMPETIQIVAPGTPVILAAENPSNWQPLPPDVHAIVARVPSTEVIPVLRKLFGSTASTR